MYVLHMSVRPIKNAGPVAMDQRSILSLLLFVVVMDVVPSEARSGIQSELLYTDDLVLMAPIMEPLGIRVTE